MVETFTRLTSLAIERKEAERRIRKLAYYDSLTGLHNRSFFTEKLQRLLNNRDRTRRGAALLYIDLDHFKWVNDSLGHDAGDQLLIEVADRMRKYVSDGDLLSRIGGDEFALLLPNLTAESDAMMTAENLMQEMARPFLLRGHECRVGLSIGVSLFPEHGLTAAELMKHADTAMYQAKSGGRNKANVYQRAWNDAVYDRFVLQTQFHRSLAENQFLLHYQPKIELSGRKTIGAEALIRWKHPELGVVPPGEFISLAEESGYIVTLGEWALREACRQNKVWQNHGFPALRIAVNVSAQQFQQAAFVSKVEGILSETGLAPEFLDIEITESALMNHEERIITTLRRLKRMGVYVSVDDFGTGYSSLNYLKSFEVSALKIDQSFVRDLPTDSKDASITRMIISLAHSLGLEVIGEGVETERQHAFLLENGCEYAQGYLYSRPLTAAEMERQFLRGPNKLNR
ncbi:putative bifunctional diguanylate cyclase/phosphodiesterase [Ferviditalea candida]|uniref:EAL domain-containing protein n=1 Tax=Ferviditalea candida TaxID=3108399 RepID=A0ABU5ZLV4_9BACL|nr:EAL domain-containing protein [Paenibacillaceae bacterium T2]